MRKPITTQEAERIVCDGGTVWRGQIKYWIPPADPFRRSGGVMENLGLSSGYIDWFQFNHMCNFSAEIDEAADGDA